MTQPPNTIASIEDLRTRARRRVPLPFSDYLESGSFQELTLRKNRSDRDGLLCKAGPCEHAVPGQ